MTSTGTSITAAQLRTHAQTLIIAASALLTDLATGKYDPELEVTEEFLRGLGLTLPPPAMIDEAAKAILALSKLVPRIPFVPDGRGNWVPITNSRVNPDGSLRDYDPAIDG